MKKWQSAQRFLSTENKANYVCISYLLIYVYTYVSIYTPFVIIIDVDGYQFYM